MAFVSTFNSLKKLMLSDSLIKTTTVTANNNTFTVNPNEAGLFLVTASANSTIAISNLNSAFSTTGSVFSILLTLGSDSLTIGWPNNIDWNGGEAPELSYKNLVTFTKFDSSNNWIGGSIVVDDTFPSA